MVMTVITLKSVSPSLKGDLSKWMQEIATGVFIGNFNSKIREKLWNRVIESIGVGEATMSYSFKNELGYGFVTNNTEQEIIDFDGIPLVLFPKDETGFTNYKTGYSNASKYYHAHRKKIVVDKIDFENYVILDIETDGLNFEKNNIIEVGAIKKCNNETIEFHSFVKSPEFIPKEVENLTGITDKLLSKEGRLLQTVLEDLVEFIEDRVIVGYNIIFDLKFINRLLRKEKCDPIENKAIDLMKIVKKKIPLLSDFKLQTVLKYLNIADIQPHRALEDSKLMLKVFEKLNEIKK